MNTQQEKATKASKLVFDEKDLVCRTHIGGQALIEGIMMRGRYNWAVAVREPSGNIHVEDHDLASGKDRNSWMYKPVVRGCTALVESLALGYKALDIAASHALLDEEEVPEQPTEYREPEYSVPEHRATEPEPAKAVEFVSGSGFLEVTPAQHQDTKKAEKADAIPKPLMTVTMIIGILLGVGIFVVLPAILTNLMVGDYGERTLAWNIIDGLLRVAIFVLYIFLIGRMQDIKRMFGYHGAEHRTIHCYERGQELLVKNAQNFPSLHVRCGTAFMLTTMIIAIFVFTVVPVNLLIDATGISNGIARLALVILSRIILLPIVAGLSYELTVKWAGSHPDSKLVQIILWPGLQMQRLTTNDPDDGMIECAIAAMNRVLERELLEHQKLEQQQPEQAQDPLDPPFSPPQTETAKQSSI